MSNEETIMCDCCGDFEGTEPVNRKSDGKVVLLCKWCDTEMFNNGDYTNITNLNKLEVKMETKGTIKAISTKMPGKYSITFDGVNWFSGFGECPVKKGDSITLEYEVNESNGRQYKNVKNIEVTGKAESSQPSIADSAKLRRATDCIICANDCYKAGILKTRDEIEDYARFLHNLIAKLEPGEVSPALGLNVTTEKIQ